MDDIIVHTGAELAAHIEKEAAMLGVRPAKFLRLIYPNPGGSFQTIRRAKHPTLATIEKLNGIFMHKVRMPEATERANAVHIQRIATIAERAEPQYVRRDPCFRCGTRGDVGCRHQGAYNG